MLAWTLVALPFEVALLTRVRGENPALQVDPEVKELAATTVEDGAQRGAAPGEAEGAASSWMDSWAVFQRQKARGGRRGHERGVTHRSLPAASCRCREVQSGSPVLLSRKSFSSDSLLVQVFLPALALSLLYFTVLSLGFLMTSHLVWAGLPPDQISVFRGLGE